VTSDPYGDPDLVALYDIDNPPGEDHEYYRALADRLQARRIVDLGCGTGLLTRTLARPGRSVVGIDPSPTMLDWARRQPGAEDVIWIEGGADAIAGPVDLVLCTGNAIMHVDDAALRTAFARVSAAVGPDGMFAFESRNPGAREWEGWTRERTYGSRRTSLGLLTEWIEVVEVEGERVSFEAHNVLPDGADRVYTSVLYFRSADVLRAALIDAGLGDIEIDGGWRAEPVEDTSRLLVVRARRS
jgi:SAM-dependent methyltransferase